MIRIIRLADMITLSRMVFAVAMVIAQPFSVLFWLCYLCGGLSDVLDGPVARKYNQQSDAGARLDSIADLVFAAAIFIVAVRSIYFPLWVWLCIAVIALLRIASYAIGFYKYHTFASLHTIMNKVSGASIFAFPLLYALVGAAAASAIVCAICFIAAVEELLITVKSKELHRDGKGLVSDSFPVGRAPGASTKNK